METAPVASRCPHLVFRSLSSFFYSLAWAETRLALARIVYNFDIESVPESRGWTTKQKAYMLWDKKPFWAVLKPVR